MNEKLRRLAAQILLLLTGFALSRTILWIAYADYFQMPGFAAAMRIFIYALRFDLSAILALNTVYIILYLLPRKPKFLSDKYLQGLFVLSNSIAWLFELADWAYFPYNHKRATADLFQMLGRKGDFLNLLPGFLKEYWYLFVAALIWLIGFRYLNRWLCRRFPVAEQAPGKIWNAIVVYLAVLGLTIVGIRGGTQLMPIGVRNAVGITENRFVPLIVNTPFSIISSWNSRQLEPVSFMPDGTAEQLIPTQKQYASGAFRRKNVVVIVLESFSKEFTGIGGMKSYTPFLDSLMQHSLVCMNAFANGYHSAEGIPAIFAGVPSLGDEPFTTSPYGINEISALPRLLQRQGYQSSFYHGGTNGTMAFDIFARNARFGRYVGRTEYNNEKDFDSDWGIWDEPFLQFAATDIGSSMKEPFMAGIFTLSSHHPYLIPKQYKGKFPSGKLAIYESIGYTDYSLRRFFETAAKQSWYPNTLFVLVADHCSALSDNLYYNVHQGRFAIPMIFYAPGDSSLKGRIDSLTQQIDILPSVLDYLSFPDRFFAFGNSIFRQHSPRWAVQKIDGHLCWTMGDYVLQSVEGKPIALFNRRTDSLDEQNILDQSGAAAQELTRYQQAFWQQYTRKMIRNELYIRN